MSLDKRQVVALVEHHEVELWVELSEAPRLGILPGHEALVLGRELYEAMVSRQPEVRPERLTDGAIAPPSQRELHRFIDPLDPVEIEQPGELAL